MKKIIFTVLLLASSTSFAQDMSGKDIANPYKKTADGEEVYVGKCKVQEDYKDKLFVVTRTLQKYVEPYEYTVAQVKKIVDKAGLVPVRFMMKEFFNEVSASDTEMMKRFAEYVDDITVETIQVLDRPNLNLLRFNVGYGGGNGGFLILLKTEDGYKKMYQSNDGSIDYCDRLVWKK